MPLTCIHCYSCSYSSTFMCHYVWPCRKKWSTMVSFF